MRSISDTIARLNAANMRSGTMGGVSSGALSPLTDFGSNPGALTGWTYVPEDAGDMPLVVVLHGCTQNAAGYDRGSGWSALAERFGFAVLLPEQSRSNNPNGCFNWFSTEDTTRDKGEVASIRQMIAKMVSDHAIDPARIHITGLSAGGAMTSAMLATYPEVFAGGAIIAGLPHGSATSVPQAFDRMRGHGHVGDEAGAAAVRAASGHAGPWPVVSVWQGSADATVNAVNADRIAGQWRVLQGLPVSPDIEDRIDGQRHRAWTDATGAVRLEIYDIAGMGHGTPIATTGDTASGAAMPYMLDVGISSTWHIAKSWGLLDGEERAVAGVASDAAGAPQWAAPVAGTGQFSSVQATIENALRSAGLMR
jgi:poly(hydroxyalkanoate) depolymerase family esterase